MIEKMAYVSVTGPKEEFDRITDEYLSRYEIQLENALLMADSSNDLSPFSESNSYKAPLDEAQKLCALLKEDKTDAKNAPLPLISSEDAISLVNSCSAELSQIEEEISSCEKKAQEIKKKIAEVAPFEGLGYDLKEIFSFKHIAHRFGRMTKGAYQDYKNTVSKESTSYFIEGSADDKYVWGAYFAPVADIDKVDAAFAYFHFERVRLSHDYSGTPKNIVETLSGELSALEGRISEAEKKRSDLLSSKKDALFSAKEKLSDMSANFEAHSYAALVGEGSLFMLSGWMSLKDSDKLAALIKENEPDVDIFVNKKPLESGMNPPTKIKNKGPLKPFEMYTKMYGLPSYGEFDPTWLVGITDSIIFGAMFGDLGQGLVLLIGGAALYFVKKSHPKLPGIISCAGFFSAIFGLMYGSFFGFEDLIPALWLKPKEAMVTLNFIGRINTVFAVAVAAGMFLTIILMLLNVYNGIKQKDFSSCLFGSNGIAGVVFYGFIVLIVLLYMTDHKLPATIIIILMVVIPLLVIGLNGPLVNLMNKKKPIEGGIGMFCLETFFDLFEICLTFFSNTLSYVRIGAFAVSHAAMMEVVLQLTGFSDGGSGSIIGLIFGNIVVIGFEGLIVGIQVLRLEYYEIFSKFYKGTGREFKPFFKRRTV